jgi:ABC-type multidrug transport system permease subunit
MRIKFVVGLVFAVAGGVLLGIALATPHTMPRWWWLCSILFIAFGLYGAAISWHPDE